MSVQSELVKKALRKHQLIRHQESAHGIVHQSDTLEPLILLYDTARFRFLSIRFRTDCPLFVLLFFISLD